jgi:beta-lactam-binding protein with PASTA domain
MIFWDLLETDLGKNFEKAVDIINKSGFKVGAVTFIEDEELLPNTVVKQFPQKEKIDHQGREIELVLVKESETEE